MSPAIAEHEESVIRRGMSMTNETPENLLKRFIERVDNHNDYTYEFNDGRLYLVHTQYPVEYSIDLYENLGGDSRYEALKPQLTHCVENILSWE